MEKRTLIMKKALELFAEQGFNATSVQQITARAGISKGAFYLSFKSKDELILALIHKFLQEFIANIDRLVRSHDSDQLLYNFYYFHFERFSEQSEFAKIFLKEQTHFLNEDFLSQITGYKEMIQTSILKMLEEVYGDKVSAIKYDLVYSIQGLMKSYMELLLFGNLPFNNKKLAQSLVEKTNVLAEYMTIPVITAKTYLQSREPLQDKVTEEKMLTIMDETLAVLDESVERESLLLLKEELKEPTLGKALIAGLLKNIENHPSCKRAAYFLHLYWGRGD